MHKGYPYHHKYKFKPLLYLVSTHSDKNVVGRRLGAMLGTIFEDLAQMPRSV